MAHVTGVIISQSSVDTPISFICRVFKISYLHLFGSGVPQRPGFPGRKTFTGRFCMASGMGPAASTVTMTKL